LRRIIFANLFFILLTFMSSGAVSAFAETEELEALGLIASSDLESTSTRSPKPLSQTAENISVVTAAEIERLNAHTLADILDMVPGLQLSHNGGPGISAYTMIQSSSFEHVLVLLDGTPITNLTSNFSDVSAIPARIIERVEIVKGPSSSAWGSALGGVINVITKSPMTGRNVAGAATVSIGSQATKDSSLELSGSVNHFGYYLSGGYLGSDGLVPTTRINSNNLHGRLTWDLPDKGQLFAQINSTNTRQGDLYSTSYDLRQHDEKRYINALAGMRYSLAHNLELAVSAYHTYNRELSAYYNISDGSVWSGQPSDLPVGFVSESVIGGTQTLTWHADNHLLVAGGGYRHLEANGNSVDGSSYSPYSRQANRWGLFLNDTITLGRFSISPGLRLDHPQTTANQLSSSLGATWQLTDSTLLRAYVARGYGMQVLQPGYDPNPTKIFTTHVGAESSAIPYLWVKATLFRNMTWGGETEQQLAMGSELEVNTKPLFNTSLGAGWTYTETTRTSDGSVVQGDKPTNTLKLALRYVDPAYRAQLTGRYIFWNGPPEDNGINSMIWDLHLGATLFKREHDSLELFFSGRNLFNSKYYSRDVFPSVDRWYEGGLRWKF